MKQDALVYSLSAELQGQVWYSGTDKHSFAKLAQIGQFFHVEDIQNPVR